VSCLDSRGKTLSTMSQNLRAPKHGIGRGGKRIRVGERTMVACIHCKEKKQRVGLLHLVDGVS
jgi:hypothetical protein